KEGLALSGSITFSLTAPDGSTAYTETDPVSAAAGWSSPIMVSTNGSGAGSQLATQAGDYYWSASFSSSNANYDGSFENGQGVTAETVHAIAPNLVIAKTGDPAPVNSTDPVHFAITLANNGAGSAFNVVLSDPLPDSTNLNWVIQSG